MKVELNQEEVSQVRYALTELSNRRAQQSIEFSGDWSLANAKEAKMLMALADRITQEIKSTT